MRGTALVAKPLALSLLRRAGAPLLLRRAGVPLLLTGGSPDGPRASELQCTVALVKNIVGTGVLTLPVGVSRLSESGASSSEALAIASVLLLVIGVLNAWGFVLIGEACAATRQGSYVGAWRKSIGPDDAFLPALASLTLCFTAAVACCTVISDTGTDLLAGFLQTDFDSLPRTGVLVGVAATILGPLCLLPSLAPLGSASVLGVLGVAVTGGAMVTRYVDGSYAEGLGSFYDSVQWVPHFTSADVLLPPTSGSVALYICAPTRHLEPECGMRPAAYQGPAYRAPPPACTHPLPTALLSNAFLAHYNAPGVYNELAPIASDDDGRKPQTRDPLARLRSSTAAEQVNAFFQDFIAAIPASLGGLIRGSPQPEEAAASAAGDPLAPFRRVVATAFSVSSVLFL
eukprot:7385871-Prymnesium_polylepis.1